MVYIVTISKCHAFHFSGLSSTLNLGKRENKLSNEGFKVNTCTTAQHRNKLKILIFLLRRWSSQFLKYFPNILLKMDHILNQNNFLIFLNYFSYVNAIFIYGKINQNSGEKYIEHIYSLHISVNSFKHICAYSFPSVLPILADRSNRQQCLDNTNLPTIGINLLRRGYQVSTHLLNLFPLHKDLNHFFQYRRQFKQAQKKHFHANLTSSQEQIEQMFQHFCAF